MTLRIRMPIVASAAQVLHGPAEKWGEPLDDVHPAFTSGSGDGIVVSVVGVPRCQDFDLRMEEDDHADIPLPSCRGEPVELGEEVAPGFGIVEVVVVELPDVRRSRRPRDVAKVVPPIVDQVEKKGSARLPVCTGVGAIGGTFEIVDGESVDEQIGVVLQCPWKAQSDAALETEPGKSEVEDLHASGWIRFLQCPFDLGRVGFLVVHPGAHRVGVSEHGDAPGPGRFRDRDLRPAKSTAVGGEERTPVVRPLAGFREAEDPLDDG